MNIGAAKEPCATRRDRNGPREEYEARSSGMMETDWRGEWELFDGARKDDNEWSVVRRKLFSGDHRTEKLRIDCQSECRGTIDGLWTNRLEPGEPVDLWKTSCQMTLQTQFYQKRIQRNHKFSTHLLTGNPSPNMPADPVSSTLVFVLLIAAKYWSGSVNPASPTVSLPIGPYACVPVLESPYRSRTSRPVV